MTTRVDPFFSCLGWDIENKQGYAPAYREVIFEDSLRVGAETKALDYCFRIGGMRTASLTSVGAEAILVLQERGEI